MTNNNPAMQKSEIISQAVGNFNGSYIDYFLVALGANSYINLQQWRIQKLN
jgi:hypothetical protein